MFDTEDGYPPEGHGGGIPWGRCPHCGHRAEIHAGPRATACTPGTCHELHPDDPCPCPGWHPLIEQRMQPRQLSLLGGAA